MFISRTLDPWLKRGSKKSGNKKKVEKEKEKKKKKKKEKKKKKKKEKKGNEDEEFDKMLGAAGLLSKSTWSMGAQGNTASSMRTSNSMFSSKYKYVHN